MDADIFLARLGRVIRNHRESLDTSQEAFADKVGTNRAYYGDVERGNRNLTIRSLMRIAEGLGVQVWDLFLEAKSMRDPQETDQSKNRAATKRRGT